MKRVTVGILCLSVAIMLLAGAFASNFQQQQQQPQTGRLTRVNKAICVVMPASNSKVKGIIRFEEKGKEIHITGEVTGLTPGKHGFHIHEFGDISALDAASAGGHFNPTDMKHGRPEDKERHVGDLGNIEANDQGVATINMTDSVIQLNGPYSIIGRAVIIHEKADDFSQPVGNAGGRVGAGVIAIAK